MDEQTQLQVFRELGNLDARVGNIEKDIGDVKADLRDVKADVKALLARDAQPPTSGRPLLTIGSTAAGGIGVGGLLVAAAQYVLGGGVPQQPPAPPAPPPVVQAQPSEQATPVTHP